MTLPTRVQILVLTNITHMYVSFKHEFSEIRDMPLVSVS